MQTPDPGRQHASYDIEAAVAEHGPDLLATQLRSVAARSSFYRDKWSPDGLLAQAETVTGDDVEALLARLPLTTKDELRRSEVDAPPFGTMLAWPADDIMVVHRTSGTTGNPLLLALTPLDMAVTAAHGGEAFRCAGMSSRHTVVHCLNYSMWAGGYSDHRSLEASGAAVVPFGVGNTAELRGLPRWLPFTAISCTPSYIRMLLDTFTDEERQAWADSLEYVLVGGEPGGSDPALKRLIREELSAELVNANYGMADMVSNFASECHLADGLHFHGFGALWPEFLDPDTGTPLPLRTGTEGVMVLTHLRKQAQPLVRFSTNDLVRIVSAEPCACGRSSFRFTVLGRADDMFVVRGINVFPAAIAASLTRFDARLTEFVVLLPIADTFDRIPLYVEAPDDDVDGPALIDHLKRDLNASVALELLDRGTIPRSEGKTRRLYRNGQTPW